MKPLVKTCLQVLLFSIAMGFLESAVVVYLRELYYPEGFSFPLKPMANHIIVTELLRELATIVMLAYVGILSGKTFIQRFSFFLFSFAIWDIFYYVFLKVLLDWPQHLFEWDILFLIPAPWIGPVIAPCIISLTMILLAGYLLYAEQHMPALRLNIFDWLMLSLSSLLYIISFMQDQLLLLFTTNQHLLMQTNVPTAYNWYLFGFALGLFLIWFALFAIRISNARLMHTDSPSKKLPW